MLQHDFPILLVSTDSQHHNCIIYQFSNVLNSRFLHSRSVSRQITLNSLVVHACMIRLSA